MLTQANNYLQAAMADLPLADLAAPLNNYAVYFYRSGGNYKAVLRDNNMLDGELWAKLHDWSLTLRCLNMAAAHAACSAALCAALHHLSHTFGTLAASAGYYLAKMRALAGHGRTLRAG
jgi:hypothetical protein